MTPEEIELARRLVDAVDFVWRPPAKAKFNDDATAISHDGSLWVWKHPHGWLPQLHDPATAGVLLSMLPNAFELRTGWTPDGDDYRLNVRVNSKCVWQNYIGPSLGVLCARALLDFHGGNHE